MKALTPRTRKAEIIDHLMTHHGCLERLLTGRTKAALIRHHDSRHASDAKPGAHPTIPHNHDGVE